MFKQIVIIAVVAGLALAASAAKLDRQTELENEIFASTIPIPAAEMKKTVDELEAIYVEQDKTGFVRDQSSRLLRDIVHSMAIVGNPTYMNCPDMDSYISTYNMLSNLKNIQPAAGPFLKFHYQFQRDICA